MNSKPSNPKDAVGIAKAHLELVPDTAVFYMSLAFLEGALKYGRYNWRVAGVRASVYRAAGDRHRKKWWNGEWADKKTKVPHLASALACDAIILDAYACGKLIDDRPPAVEFARLVDEAETHITHLMELFKDYNPKQYTIADTETDHGGSGSDTAQARGTETRRRGNGARLALRKVQREHVSNRAGNGRHARRARL